MSTYVSRHRVNRPIDEVFDVIGTRCFENHPKWEREVVEVRPLTPGPIGVGSRAVMVRQEYGRRQEVPYEVTDFTPPARIAFRHVGGQMLFEIAFELEAAGATATDLAVRVRMDPRGAFRIMSPVLAMNLPRTSERITRSMVGLVEAEGVRPAGAVTPGTAPR